MNNKTREELYDDLILHFARFCWLRRDKAAPSGKTWAEVFEKKSGINLYRYKEDRVNERKH